MPGRCLEQIDLPSAYMVYAVEIVSGGSYDFHGRRIVSHPLSNRTQPGKI
jgi:hypothetical protein